MSQILSSEEIEALQDALDEGRVDLGVREPVGGGDAQYAPWRFGEGASAGEDSRSALEGVLNRATSGVEGWLVQMLERDLRLVLDLLESMPFGQFRDEFRVDERPLAFVPFAASPSGADGLIVLEPGLLYAAVEGVMGGASAVEHLGMQAGLHDRMPSSIDLRVAARLARRYLAGLGAAWAGREPQRFDVRAADGDPRACRVVADRTTVAVARYRAVTLAADLGEMAVVIPEWLTRGLKPRERARPREPVAAMEARLREMPVTVSAELEPRRITVRDLLAMRVGDVLTVDGGSRVRVTVEGVPRWLAILGASGGRRAVQIQETIAGGGHE